MKKLHLRLLHALLVFFIFTQCGTDDGLHQPNNQTVSFTINFSGITLEQSAYSGKSASKTNAVAKTSEWNHIFEENLAIEFINASSGTSYTLEYNPALPNADYSIILPFGTYNYILESNGDIYSPYIPFIAQGEIEIATNAVTLDLVGVTEYGLVTVNQEYISEAHIEDSQLGTIDLSESQGHYYTYVLEGQTPLAVVSETILNTTPTLQLPAIEALVHYNLMLKINELNVTSFTLAPFDQVDFYFDISSPFYVAENGVTIKAREGVEVGTQADLNGVTYTLLDRAMLDTMIANGEDVTKVVTTGITDMSSLFRDQTEFNQDISTWDVSSVTHINAMFYRASIFNQDIGYWDVSNVVDMNYLFFEAFDFNQDIGNWDVSNVINMGAIFLTASSFNQDIGNWDVSNVTDFSNMFRSTKDFNQDISNWDISKATSIGFMFYNATAFNQPLGNWNTSNVIDMSGVFWGANNFNQPIGNWDTSSVRNFYGMFQANILFNQDISNWDTSSATSMRAMFYGALSFNQNISSWDTSQVENMDSVFHEALSFNQDISSWNTSNVTNMNYIFKGASSFNQNISSWNVCNVIEFENFDSNTSLEWTSEEKPHFGDSVLCDGVTSAFYVAENGVTIKAREGITVGTQDELNGVTYTLVDRAMLDTMIANGEDITRVVTTGITDMGILFSNQTEFNQDISTWDTSNVIAMHGMFSGATNFNQDIGNWNTSNVETMVNMFTSASSFNQNIGNWNTSNVTSMDNMFTSASSFNQNIGNWNTSNVTDMFQMFWGASSFNQDISGWNVCNVVNYTGFDDNTSSEWTSEEKPHLGDPDNCSGN